ncbi:MAG: phenylacetate--CoA ligase family protein [Phycisphaerales bacterium]|nr:phenylacetate--CoA ligase family protein [Phycisphaerales bacterium]
MGRLFDVYAKMPVVLQNAACSIAGINMRLTRHNRTFKDALAFLEESQWWSRADQDAHQDELLRQTIKHAFDTVPYYREVFDNLKLHPDDIRTSADLTKLPILDKQTVRDRASDLCSRGWPAKRCVKTVTGGTTGKALALVQDSDSMPWQWATQWRHRRRFGCDFGDPFVVFAGRSVVPLSNMNPPIWRRNLPMHQTYVSLHHMTKQNMPALAAYLQRRKVAYYAGYPSGLYLLACYMLDHDIKLPHPPRITYTGAETLLPHQRHVIGQAFGTDVGDHYGATEVCVFVSECEKHLYHVDPEFAVTEFLEMDGMPNNVRRIIGTTLHNPAMPLIRYDIGDIATLSDKTCSCGRQSRTVEMIDGRIESYIITPDGRQMGRLDFLFKKSGKIDEAQLIQDHPDHVTVRLVIGKSYAARDEEHLLSEMRQYLGDVIRIDIEHVDEIPREANGKFRQIVSHVFRDHHRQVPAADASAGHSPAR